MNLLSHIENLIDDQEKVLRERAKSFVPQDGLDKIEKLLESDPSDEQLPTRVFERLSVFFDSGLLVRRAAQQDVYRVTDLFWRGNVFNLQIQDQVQTGRLIPENPPLQVQRAPASKLLESLNLSFLSPGPDADAYLIKPTPAVSYVLITNLAAPWSADHVAHAHRLVNKCFIF